MVVAAVWLLCGCCVVLSSHSQYGGFWSIPSGVAPVPIIDAPAAMAAPGRSASIRISPFIPVCFLVACINDA